MNQSIPQYPAELPGTFWGVTVYYNPVRYETKLKNYMRFREASKIQGLNLLSVELAFGDAEFELQEDDADIMIQLRSTSILWQKERLLNIGLQHLPEDCDKVVWLDADVIFCNSQWVDETRRLLEIYKVVQPYSFCALLPKGRYTANVDKLPFGRGEGEKLCSMGYAFAHFGQLRHPNGLGGVGAHSGYAWAARQNVFDQCGFYDRLILGGGDGLMASAFFTGRFAPVHSYSEKMEEDLEKWTRKIHGNIKGSIYYTNGEVLHLWHGSSRYRSYTPRYTILKKHNFNPYKDISIGVSGCWEWASNKPDLRRQVERYFWLRNEDARLSLKIILEIAKAVKKVWRLVSKP